MSKMTESDRSIRIEYTCQHLSCRDPKCYRGTLEVPAVVYQNLYGQTSDPKTMRCRTKDCNLGFPQEFLIEKLDDIIFTKDDTAASKIKIELEAEIKKLRIIESEHAMLEKAQSAKIVTLYEQLKKARGE